MPRLPLALLLLFSLPALAGEPGAGRVVHLRINRPDAPETPVQEVLVAGGVSTVLTVPWELRARGTGVVGRGEKPFEVLLGAKRAVVTPTRPLVPGERFPFVLRLGDGTVIPLVLVATPAGRTPDRDVAFSFDFDEAANLRVQLAAVEDRARGLEEQLRQALEEQESEDTALAHLVAAGHARAGALRKVGERVLVTDERGRIALITYATPPGHVPRKTAAVLLMTNVGNEPMKMRAVDLYSRPTLARVPYGARARPVAVAPGAQGVLSVVMDGESMQADGSFSLELRVHRGDSETGLTVDLSAQDFASASPWWPF